MAAVCVSVTCCYCDEEITTYAILNAIQLADGASSDNDYYNGQFLTLIQTDSDGVQTRQTRRIIDYDGGEKIAYLGSFIDAAANATAITGTYKVTAAVTDSKTFTLGTVTTTDLNKLGVGDVVSAVYAGMATVEEGTKIESINTTTKVITYGFCASHAKAEEGDSWAADIPLPSWVSTDPNCQYDYTTGVTNSFLNGRASNLVSSDSFTLRDSAIVIGFLVIISFADISSNFLFD